MHLLNSQVCLLYYYTPFSSHGLLHIIIRIFGGLFILSFLVYLYNFRGISLLFVSGFCPCILLPFYLIKKKGCSTYVSALFLYLHGEMIVGVCVCVKPKVCPKGCFFVCV